MTNDLETRTSEEPPAGSLADTLDPPAVATGDDGGTIAERAERNPANLGDDVRDAGDVTHPTPDPDGPRL